MIEELNKVMVQETAALGNLLLELESNTGALL